MSTEQATDRLGDVLQLSLHLWNKILLNTSSALTGGLTLVREYHIDVLDVFFLVSILLSIGTIVLVTIFSSAINHIYNALRRGVSSNKGERSRGHDGGGLSPEGGDNMHGPLSRNISQDTSKWVNTTLHWLFQQHEAQFLSTWLESLSKHVAKDGGSVQLKFDLLNPDKLPPKLKNIKVENHPTSGALTISCDVEVSLLAFNVFATQQTYSQVKLSNFEVKVEHLKGKLLCKTEKNKKVTEICASFDEQPHLSVATKPATTNLTSDEGVDAALVEELVRSGIRLANVELTLSSAEAEGQTDVSNFSANANYPPPKQDTAVDEGLISAESVSSPQTYFRNPTPPTKPKVSKEQRLLVKIIKANGLALRDPSGCCDPYCYVELDNPLQQHKTNAIRNTSNPFWDEHFLFDLTSRSREIRLVILDRDKSPNDEFMGLALVPVETLRKNPSTRQILPLEGRQGRDDHVNGSITVEFLFMELAEEPGKSATSNAQVAARPPYLSVNPSKVVETSRVITPGGTVITTVTTTAERMSRSTERNNGIVNDTPRMVSRLPQSEERSPSLEDVNTVDGGHDEAAYDMQLEEKDEVDVPDTDESGNNKPNRSRSLSPGKKQRKRDPSPSKAIKKFFSMKREKQDIRTPDTPPIMVRLQTKENSLNVPSGSHLSRSHESGLHTADSANKNDTTSLRSSGSNSSMLAYEHSTLVMEYPDVDEDNRLTHKYCLIAKNLAKSGKYNNKGTKLHIYNDHVFVATHFDSTELCEVCQRNISRRMGVGKQGYKCRDCEYICHKQCHYKTDVVCPSSTVNRLEMEYVGGENVEDPI